MAEFKNRVFGCAIVKAINANYNADFTHQPRTLPDGIVYATDKAFKYSLRHYFINQYPDEKILYYKRLNSDMNPLTLAESYQEILGDMHNLFGDTNSVSILMTAEGSYELIAPIKGDTVQKMLNYVGFETGWLLNAYRQRLQTAPLNAGQRQLYRRELEAGLDGYTYFEMSF